MHTHISALRLFYGATFCWWLPLQTFREVLQRYASTSVRLQDVQCIITMARWKDYNLPGRFQPHQQI